MAEPEVKTFLDDPEILEMEERVRPFYSLYDHWERNQWATSDIDLTRDRESFEALDAEEQRKLVWIFAHRFHGEYNVSTMLTPVLDTAEEPEIRLLLATQIADEFRHLQAVLRVYEHVFGVRGFRSAQHMADENLDPLARFLLYDALERNVVPLRNGADERQFLKAVMSYHVLAEGVVGRATQAFAAEQYASYGDGFPGLIAGQRMVSRDEARHIGIGISYARWRMQREPERTREIISETLDDFAEVATEGLEMAKERVPELVSAGYGVDPDAFYGEVTRLLRLRLKSIGYLDGDTSA